MSCANLFRNMVPSASLSFSCVVADFASIPFASGYSGEFHDQPTLILNLDRALVGQVHINSSQTPRHPLQATSPLSK